jgi:2-polyprenyl-6-methoxyphenol hydroxylase-like FAD-dependent oxidoreductase
MVVTAKRRNRSARSCSQNDPHHRFSGMLVDNVPQWREDTQFISVEGDVNVLAFPQGGGRIRLYIGFGLEQKTRLAGPQGPQRFLEAFRLKSVPGSEAIAAGRPIGPCLVYPNNDTWIDEPFAEGVVLIGDAAGRNDPITGQGLSITHRDVRIVRDILLGEANWSTDAFVPYGAERKERMRRLRISARIAGHSGGRVRRPRARAPSSCRGAASRDGARVAGDPDAVHRAPMHCHRNLTRTKRSPRSLPEWSDASSDRVATGAISP